MFTEDIDELAREFLVHVERLHRIETNRTYGIRRTRKLPPVVRRSGVELRRRYRDVTKRIRALSTEEAAEFGMKVQQYLDPGSYQQKEAITLLQKTAVRRWRNSP
jgi:hypothetical protein